MTERFGGQEIFQNKRGDDVFSTEEAMTANFKEQRGL